MKKIIVMVLAISMIVVFAVGCTPKTPEKVNVNLTDIHNAVKESLGEEYAPNRDMEKEEIENIVGVKAEDMEEYIAQAPMISVSVDTFIAIKAKEGKADAIEEGLNKYKKFLVEDSLQYPMNDAKVNASEVVRHGDYVFFVMLGKYDDRQEATEEERLEFAKEETKKVVDIINKFFK